MAAGRPAPSVAGQACACASAQALSVEVVQHKDLIAGRTLLSGPALATREALEHVAATWRAAGPLTARLDEHVGASAVPADRQR
jgi:hypothetical protein